MHVPHWTWLLVGTAALPLCTGCLASIRSRPLVTGPDCTEMPATLEAGVAEATVGSSVSREADAFAHVSGEGAVAIGVAPRLEVRLEGTGLLHEVAGGAVRSGHDDAIVAAKLRLLEAPSHPSFRPGLSVAIGGSIPSGSRAFRSRRMQPDLRLFAAWALHPRWMFVQGAALARPFDGEQNVLELSSRSVLAYAASERVSVFGEAFALAPQDGSGVIPFLGGGTVLALREGVQVEARGGLGPSVGRRDGFASVAVVFAR